MNPYKEFTKMWFAYSWFTLYRNEYPDVTWKYLFRAAEAGEI